MGTLAEHPEFGRADRTPLQMGIRMFRTPSGGILHQFGNTWLDLSNVASITMNEDTDEEDPELKYQAEIGFKESDRMTDDPLTLEPSDSYILKQYLEQQVS